MGLYTKRNAGLQIGMVASHRGGPHSPPTPPPPHLPNRSRYTKGSSPKGRNVFLKNMEPFMKWCAACGRVGVP